MRPACRRKDSSVISLPRSARIGVGLALAASLVALTGCATGSSAGTSSSGSTTVKFALDWTPNTNHTGLYVAEEKGWFKAAGINLDILPYSNSSTDTLINAGSAQFGISFENQAITSAAAGVKNVSVMSVLQHDATTIGVLKSNTKINSPKDLDGTTYGEAGPTTVFQKMVVDAIKADGGTGKFTTINLGTSAYDALYKGKVDFTGAFKTWEGIQGKLAGTPMKYFDLSKYGLPDQYAVVIEGNQSWMKAHPALAKKFVQVLQRGYTYAADHPKAAAKILIDENPGVFTDTKLVYESQALISKDYLKDSNGVVGTQTKAMWQDLANYYVKEGFLADKNGKTITAPFDTSSIFTNSLVKK
jgi:ABC-type nitrate/sulfonate/bicarbonate transport system substrate-binding protein